MARDDNPPADPPGALPRGTRLGEFELRRVLGIGGFGIVYLAVDHALEREVAIKEYMPTSLVGRDGAMAVSLLSQTHAEPFSLGLRSFVNEARLLARFDHPSLVKVLRYWEANNTAYMAMPCYAGSNLHAVRRAMVQPPDETWLRGLLEPLLGALERLHGEAVYHRDISPDNVILQPDGRPVLLDFGAARRVLGDKSMALTAILKPAYAPIEQYAEAGAVKQGPWTDLYSLGGTLHYLLLGRAPVPATARTVVDELPPLAGQAAQLPGCSVGFLQCVDWMLQPRPADRPQNVAALRARLASLPPAPVATASTGGDAWPRTQWLGDAAPGHAPTVLDPSLVPATVLAPPAPDTRPTVLMHRADTRPPDATEVMPRGHPPTPASAAAGMPGAVPATPLPGRNGLDGAPPASPGSRGSAASPDTPAASASLASAASPAVPAVPAPAARSAAPASPASSLAAAASRTEPTLDEGTTPFADLPRTAGPAPRAAAPTRRWPLAVGAVTVLAIALWLAVRPGGAPPQPAAPTLAAPASGPVDAAADTASAPTGSIAATPPPAPTPDSASSGPAALQPAMAAVMAAGSPISAASAPANRKAIRAPAVTAAGAPATSTAPLPSTPAPTPTSLPTTPAAISPPLASTATPNGAPPSLATSITRLPPADTSSALAAPAATATPSTRLQPTVPSAEAGRPASGLPAGATPSAPTSAAISGKTPATAQPRTVDRDAEPVLLQARALSPAERCEGRALAALWSCIDRHCKAEPGLRDHPDCVKARREAEQRATPSR